MSESRHYLNLKQEETNFHLWGLKEFEYHLLRESSLPITENLLFLFNLYLSERDDPERLTLPKAFVTLEHLFGQTMSFFDEWKGSFAFPILVELNKENGQFYYILKVFDHRGTLSFTWYRIVETGIDDYDINIYRDPFELEFSQEEMNKFLSYFYGYLIGSSRILKKVPPSPFLKKVNSNLIIYGYRDGEFFEEEFESNEDYQQAIQDFEEVYGNNLLENQSLEVQSLLQKITSSDKIY